MADDTRKWVEALGEGERIFCTRIGSPFQDVQSGDARIWLASSIQERVIRLSMDDPEGETIIDLPPAKVRRLIVELNEALRTIED